MLHGFTCTCTIGDCCTAFFDQAIAQQMVTIDANCKSKYIMLTESVYISFFQLHRSCCTEKKLCKVVPLLTTRLQADYKQNKKNCFCARWNGVPIVKMSYI